MVFVATQTHNRPRVAEACLAQQAGAIGDAGQLHIWDDHSTEPPDLSGIAGIVTHKEPMWLGPHKIRIVQLQAFLDSGLSELYLTDSDAVLDPEWLAVCRSLSAKAPIVSLFNSEFHRRFTRGAGTHEGHNYLVRAYAPGISYYMTRETVEAALPTMRSITGEWDFVLPSICGCRCAVSFDSYCDHYGAGGLHTQPGDWERDTAVNPTQYLRELRKSLLPTLQ